MEELQLTLTPSRVDQRYQGLMLANWRVGQTINALVSDRMPSGEILLKVGSQSFVTSRDIPVQPGTRIQLEIQQTVPRLVLKLVSQIKADVAYNAPEIHLNGPPQNHDKRGVSGLASLLKNLATSLPKASAGSISDALELRPLLMSNFLSPGALNAKSIQTALVLSGIFTEALWLSSKPFLGARSTKTILMLLKQRAVEALSSSNLTSDERRALSRIVSDIDFSVTTITHQQISSIPQDSERIRWLATLPLEFGEDIVEIEVEIERSSPQEDEESPGWRFGFFLTLKALGLVRVSVEMKNDRLGVDFNVAELINERLNGSLHVLTDRLIASGLQLDRVSSSVLKAESDATRQRPHVSLDISV